MQEPGEGIAPTRPPSTTLGERTIAEIGGRVEPSRSPRRLIALGRISSRPMAMRRLARGTGAIAEGSRESEG
jgi:hypothetical protein